MYANLNVFQLMTNCISNAGSQMSTSLTNIKWLGNYSSNFTKSNNANSMERNHRDIHIIATEKQIEQVCIYY